MKKNILLIFIFLIFSSFVFATEINDIKFNSGKFSIELSSGNKDDYTISVDEETKLIYIEILNINKKSINRFSREIENKMKSSPLFEEILVEKTEENLALTLQISSGVSFSANSSNRKIEINFSNNLKNKPLIIIDPGHGGKDPGALRGNVLEKDIVLAVSKYLRDELKKDFDIIMTRDADFFVKLHERPKIGNKKGAKLFVSIHANAANNKKANGVEVFYFSKKSSPYAERIANFENSFGEKFGENTSDIAQISGELAYKKNQENSIRLANDIVQKVSNNLPLRNGKTHGANFAVLRGFNGTGILVELGFITNKHDVKIITNKARQKELAEQIAKSIVEYFE